MKKTEEVSHIKTVMEIDGITIEVERKKIRSLNLYVKPPDGHIRVSAPVQTSDAVIREFVLSHWDWITEKQQRVKQQTEKLLFQTGDILLIYGTPHKLLVHEQNSTRAAIQCTKNELVLTMPKNSTSEQREAVLRAWQRQSLKQLVQPMLIHWARILQVTVREWHIKSMKTKWGTCNTGAHRIWLSLALAEKPPECVEYVVVHELCHLLEPSHNVRFWQLMTQFLPDWKQRRERLNQK